MWYLDAPWVICALVDRRVPNEEKRRIALALHSFSQPSCYPPTAAKPLLPKLPVHTDSFWPCDGSLPSLSALVSERSWQLFSVLDLEKQDCSKLTEDPSTWRDQASFRRFSDYISGLLATNDTGERGVKLGQDFSGISQNEETRQNAFLSVAENRKTVIVRATKGAIINM